MMLNCRAKSEVKRPRHSGGILYKTQDHTVKLLEIYDFNGSLTTCKNKLYSLNYS